MLSDSMNKHLNDQVNAELDASYKYLAASVYCKAISFNGCASWLAEQAKEEYEHAMKIANYLVDHGAQVIFSSISAPKNSFNGITEIFNFALQGELQITERIQSIAKAAHSEEDLTTLSLMQWFLMEQVEEVSAVTEIVDKLKVIGNDGAGLLLLDSQLAVREAN